ncbi:N-6 DNA methylase [Rickettsia endosymbiont of Ixodes scapularis]|uniref:N-6 DNA methylase n=1 Tax=Rickettsia endosymbiont of Ixodes scapularis TaxID=444612 RepID=UPI00031346C6|nr:N-6 DNA methylase [Rickettsia endosymbiont of Ixodes scapularis]
MSKEQKAVSGYDTVFKKVLEKFRDFGKLDHIDLDFKSKLFESFLKESISKKNWGQFFTPISVVRAINDMARSDLKEGMKICDPACGVGKFPLEYVKHNLQELFEIKNGKVKSKVKIIGFDKGFDNDEKKTIILAKANMLIYFCELVKDNPEYKEEFANLFNETFILKTNSILGTLSEPIENEYDLILTNPPYVTSGSSNLKEEIAKSTTLKNYYKTNAMGVEGLFMEWIIKALKPNGKAFVVVPDGIFNRKNDRNLRQLILDNCFVDAIISLPLKTFFTTPKKTYILAVTKKSEHSQTQIDPIFTYLCSEIGESRDVYRFNIEQDDLKESVELFRSFKGNKKGFAKLNHDKRCKLQFVELFKAEKDWSIEKFWTEEERKELGLSLDNDFSSIQDFKSNIQNISDELSSMIQEINAIAPEQGILFKNFTLEEVLNPRSGNQDLKKSFIEKNKGEFPVYSSNTKENGLFGYINTYDYDAECVQITTNGVYAGTVFYRKKHKFSINSDARLYIPKHPNLDCLYLTYELQRVLNKNNFSWEYKPTIARTKYLQVKIPVTKEGSFDLKKQKELAEKYRKIEEVKKNIKAELEKIENIKVDISI